MDEQVKDPNWLSGFIDGEGSFEVAVYKSGQRRLGTNVGLSFTICQHTRDKLLRVKLQRFIGGIYFVGYPCSCLSKRWDSKETNY